MIKKVGTNRRKLFSIQSGSPTRRATVATERGHGAAIGGILGGAWGLKVATPLALGGMICGGGVKHSLKVGGLIAGGSAILGAMAGAIAGVTTNKSIEQFKACTMETVLLEVKRLMEKHTEDTTNAKRRLMVDKTPEDCDIIFAIQEGNGVIYLNSKKQDIINGLDKQLDFVISGNSKSNYTSERTNGGFLITLTGLTVSNFVGLILGSIYMANQQGKPLCLKVGCLSKRVMDDLLEK